MTMEKSKAQIAVENIISIREKELFEFYQKHHELLSEYNRMKKELHNNKMQLERIKNSHRETLNKLLI